MLKIDEFNRLTVKLMICKYLYYIKDTNMMLDYEYDMLERRWHALGMQLNILTREDTSPCVGFNKNHPQAILATELGEIWLKRNNVQ